ncbi:MAG: IS3 family transposase [Pirellulaceae bacterium]
MIEPGNAGLSIGKQCQLLLISRSSFYYTPKGETALNLGLMRHIDEQFLETPFFGVRQMTWHLRNEGHLVNEKRIRRLMRLMGLMPIYQKPNTSKAAKGHKIYPYLLRGLRVDQANQAWCADITYLPMRRKRWGGRPFYGIDVPKWFCDHIKRRRPWKSVTSLV